MRVITAAVFLAASTASIASGQPRSAPPLTPAPLTWDVTVEGAIKKLEHAKMKPEYGTRRGYFATAPGEPVKHTSEPEISFTPRKGWRGTALFNWNDAAQDERLVSLAFTASLTAQELEDELHALDRRFGKPSKRTGPQRLWVRGGVWLVVTYNDLPDPQTQRFEIYIAFRRDDRPLPP